METVAEQAEEIEIKNPGDFHQDVRVYGTLMENLIDICAAVGKLPGKPCDR